MNKAETMTVATKVGDEAYTVLGEGLERWIGERFHVAQSGMSLSYIGNKFNIGMPLSYCSTRPTFRNPFHVTNANLCQVIA